MIPMPLVIGMSATPQRFESLLAGAPNTVQKIHVPVSEVRDSGLLKDRIIIRFPDMPLMANMTILKSAIENWKDKCARWDAYCTREKEKKVNPVLVIQVEDGNSSQVTSTDMDVCIAYIEEGMGRKLLPGEIVHTFNDHGTLMVGETEIRQVDASRIEEDQDIRVVLPAGGNHDVFPVGSGLYVYCTAAGQDDPHAVGQAYRCGCGTEQC